MDDARLAGAEDTIFPWRSCFRDEDRGRDDSAGAEIIPRGRDSSTGADAALIGLGIPPGRDSAGAEIPKPDGWDSAGDEIPIVILGITISSRILTPIAAESVS